MRPFWINLRQKYESCENNRRIDGCCPGLFGTGFGLPFGTQSVTAQGTANAAAAEAADATTIFYNPAGLAKLNGSEITAAANIVAPHIEYHDAEASFVRGGRVQGKTEGKITKDVVLAPHLYGAYRVNPDLTLGLGVYVPFASSTEYQEDSVLRHNINKLGLTTIAVEPVVAYKVSENHAFGAGLIAQYSSAELRKYADWNASGRLGPHNGLSDGHAEVKGKDWGFGYQLGWLWDINPRTRVGVNYRSKVNHNLKGTADWQADGRAVTTPRSGIRRKECLRCAYRHCFRLQAAREGRCQNRNAGILVAARHVSRNR